MYVGSATAKEMLLSRWRTYVNNGHCGNKDLIALVEEKGFDYIKENFQYTILENYNSKVDDEYSMIFKKNKKKQTKVVCFLTF